VKGPLPIWTFRIVLAEMVRGTTKRRGALPQLASLCDAREPVKSRISRVSQGQSKSEANQSQLDPAAVPGSRPTNRSIFPPSIPSGCTNPSESLDGSENWVPLMRSAKLQCCDVIVHCAEIDQLPVSDLDFDMERGISEY
jgi:hypothetical protein